MDRFIESLRRLFLVGKITAEKVAGMVSEKKITAEEGVYITAPVEPSVDAYKQYYETVNGAVLGGEGK